MAKTKKPNLKDQNLQKANNTKKAKPSKYLGIKRPNNENCLKVLNFESSKWSTA
jgi:hypothetical protein